MPHLTLMEIKDIVDDISYKDWRIRVKADNYNRPYLQVTFLAEDLSEKTIVEQHGRKWWLSQFMTRSEIVSTALMAVLAAEEHEAREAFRYNGRPIFGPHFDVDALWEFVKLDNIDVRTGEWVSDPAPA